MPQPVPSNQPLPTPLNPALDMPFVSPVVLSLYQQGEWDKAYQILEERLTEERDLQLAAQLNIALVEGMNQEDFKRGLQNKERKHELLDQAEEIAGDRNDDLLLAAVFHNRGMALHIEFIMDEGDEERELECFTRAYDLRTAAGHDAEAAYPLAMVGIFHHVDRLDRETAQPILEDAFDLAGRTGAPIGRSEASRHLGQIRQELGDPSGALPWLDESLRVRSEAGWKTLVPSALHAIASAQLDSGDIAGAKKSLARARATAEEYDAIFMLSMIAITEAYADFASLAPGVWNRRHP